MVRANALALALVLALAGVMLIGVPSTAAAALGDEVDDKTDPLWMRSTLFGNIGGLRPWLDGYGVSLGLRETSEYFRDVSGGIQRRGAYDGLTTITLGVDTSKALGISGGSFNVSALQIHGHGLSQSTLMSLQNVSGVEAGASTRLWELWYQQALMGGRLNRSSWSAITPRHL
jgi:porin